MDIKDRVKQRVQARANQIAVDRQSGNGLWKRIKELFVGPEIVRQVNRRLRDKSEFRWEVNQAFGIDERDKLRGGRYERFTGRRYHSGYLEPGGATRLLHGHRG